MPPLKRKCFSHLALNYVLLCPVSLEVILMLSWLWRVYFDNKKRGDLLYEYFEKKPLFSLISFFSLASVVPGIMGKMILWYLAKMEIEVMHIHIYIRINKACNCVQLLLPLLCIPCVLVICDHTQGPQLDVDKGMGPVPDEIIYTNGPRCLAPA